MYAQALEGDTWKGEKMDKAKIDKMSGMRRITQELPILTKPRPADWAAIRADADHSKAEQRRR